MHRVFFVLDRKYPVLYFDFNHLSNGMYRIGKGFVNYISVMNQ